MVIWRAYYVCCSQCGHRNRVHPSPRKAVRLALTRQAGNCKGCGKVLNPRISDSDAPLVRKVRSELLAEGIQPLY